MMALEVYFIIILLFSDNICWSKKEAVGFVRDDDGHSIFTFGSLLDLEESTKTPKNLTRTKRSLFTEDPCFNNALCKTQNEREIRSCHCDRLCLFFGDCCYDATMEIDININITNYSNLSCVHYEDEDFRMITWCSTEYTNQMVISQCKSRESVINRLPVFDKNGNAFVNVYCAMCNNVDRYTMSEMEYKISPCQQYTQDINQTDLYSVVTNCDQNIEKPLAPQGFNFRRCRTTQINNGNPICQQYQSLMYAYIDNKLKLLKNYFCASIDKSRRVRCLNFFPPGDVHGMYPLTVLFRFTPPKIKIDGSQCLKSEIFNSTTGICSKKACGNSTKLSNGLCYKGFYSKTEFYIYYSFESNHILTGDDFKSLSVLHYFSFNGKEYSSLLYLFKTSENIPSTNGTSGYAAVKIITSSAYGMKPEQYKYMKNSLSSNNFTYTQINSNEKEETVIKMLTVSKNETPFLRHERPKNSYTYVARLYKTQYLSQVSFGKYFNDSTFCKDITIDTTVLNYSQYLNAPREKKNVALEIAGRYLVVDSWKCQEYVEWKDKKNLGKIQVQNPFNIESILTYICMGLSCISLLCAIGIHRILSFTDTIPGSNTFNLMINMLISHVLFMVGIGADDFQILCKCLGVAIHYFWLTMFSFMTIGIVHVTHTFSKLATQPNAFKSKSVASNRKLTLLGYGMALFVVIPSLIVELVDYIPLSVGYGGNICFPSDYPAILIFVSGPIVLSVSINLICLVVSICTIGKQATQCKAVEKGYFAYFSVYIRLTCLSGVLWLFGIFSAFFQSQVLDIIFIIAVGLQGMFISVATTCLPRVYRRLKEWSNSRDKKEDLRLQTL